MLFHPTVHSEELHIFAMSSSHIYDIASSFPQRIKQQQERMDVELWCCKVGWVGIGWMDISGQGEV